MQKSTLKSRNPCEIQKSNLKSEIHVKSSGFQNLVRRERCGGPLGMDHSQHNSTNNARTPSYYGHAQVREYPDSTISKVLTVLKWRMITTLKLIEGYRTALLSLRYT